MDNYNEIITVPDEIIEDSVVVEDVEEILVVPETPKVNSNDVLFVYVPVATYDVPGLSSYNREHFSIDKSSKVSLNGELLSKFLNKVIDISDYKRVYAITPDGTQILINVSEEADADSLVIRNKTGHIKSKTPLDFEDTTNKKYVDDTIKQGDEALKSEIDRDFVKSENPYTEGFSQHAGLMQVENLRVTEAINVVGVDSSTNINSTGIETGYVVTSKGGTFPELNANNATFRNIHVTGDVNVEDIKTLQVEDAYVVVNANDTNMRTLESGLVILTGKLGDNDQKSAYGIVWDPTFDVVNLGHGVYEDGVFRGQGAYPIALREDEFNMDSDKVPLWDYERRIITTRKSGLVVSVLKDIIEKYEDGSFLTDDDLKDIEGIKGDPGKDGVGISSIEKTAVNGLVDTYTITLTNGTKKEYTVTNGKDGQNGEDGKSIVIDYTEEQADGQSVLLGFSDGTTITIRHGEPGKPFRIERIATTVEELQINHATDGVPIGGFALISNDVAEETNAWLFVKTQDNYAFLTDLSGAQGIQGPRGIQGLKGNDGNTPYIQNGYWYIDGLNTQVKAEGVDGKDGTDGKDGNDGKNGSRGTGILKVTTQPSSYTTAIGSYTPKYRIALSTVKTQSGVGEVLIGDTIFYSYYQYVVDYIDSSYAYISATHVSMRGATGAAGKDGTNGKDGYTPVKGTDYYTAKDKAELISELTDKLSLGIASDGLIYIFVDGTPVGTGIPQGQSGDVFGYVDENNTIVLNGNLADGTYTVKYEMDNGNVVNVGNMVLDSTVYYTVTSNLTNCNISNSTKTVAEGSGYSATITANDGYELKSVSVTMGGSAVSVSGGIINISNVTDDIVITAVAEEIRVEITNLIPTLTDVDLSTIYNGIGYKENTRISISAISDSNPTGEKTQAGTTLLGIMPLGNDGDVLHLSGAKFFDNTGGNTYSGLIWYYNASGTLLNTGTISVPDTGLLSTDANGDATFTMTHSKMKLIDGTAYIRLNIANPTGELIMTRNQLIPKD